MVIRGATRGNGKQLAAYLLREAGNDAVQILEAAGQGDAPSEALHEALFDMDVSAELSRSSKGLYHAQINPAPGEDAAMNPQDWIKAVDILAENLGMSQQRRVIVLHEKKGRTHAHVVFERYDHDKGRMVSDSFSRLAQDRARQQMEIELGHKRTPKRNAHRPELKQALTETWEQTKDGAEFVKAARAKNYLVAAGVPRHPFMVVDEHGRSFDLVRQLKGVRIKEVRAKLKGVELIGEKEAIEIMRSQPSEGSGKDGREKAKAAFKATYREATGQSRELLAVRNAEDILAAARARSAEPAKTDVALNTVKEKAARSFAQSKGDMLQEDEPTAATKRKKEAAKGFAENRDALKVPEDIPAPVPAQPKAPAEQAREAAKEKFRQQMQDMQQRQREQKGRGREPD